MYNIYICVWELFDVFYLQKDHFVFNTLYFDYCLFYLSITFFIRKFFSSLSHSKSHSKVIVKGMWLSV